MYDRGHLQYMNHAAKCEFIKEGFFDFYERRYQKFVARDQFAHGGFLRVWESIKECISEEIQNKYYQKITVVGYSHGAALAVLCHEWIWYHHPTARKNLTGYGFGCPRVLYGCATPTLARRWERFYVVRNIDDAVTHLPPRIMGYCHVGNLITVGEAGRYSQIDAHRPENYQKELK